MQIKGVRSVSTSVDQLGVAALPDVVNLEVTTKCNLQCVFCRNSEPTIRSRGSMSLDMVHLVIDQVSESCRRVNLWGTGEPLLHPEFFHMAAYAAAARIPRIKLSTNGHLLTARNVDRLLECGVTEVRIPIEGASQEEYGEQRLRGSLQRVLEGTERLVRRRDELGARLKVVVCTVYTAQTPESVQDIRDLAERLGADEYEVLPNIWADQLPGLTKDEPHKRCDQQTRVLSVLANGDVIPCCHICMGEMTLGNVLTSPIREIWNGEQALSTRSAFLAGHFPFCRGCNYGVKLPFIEFAPLALTPSEIGDSLRSSPS